MIDALKKHFDDFSMAARIKPAITACIPFLAIAMYKGIWDGNLSEAGITFSLAVILIGFAAHIVRELGKAYEEKMIKNLGGLPSTIILRFSDNRIDPISKSRYHCWLNSKIADLQMPLSSEEETADPKSDAKYASAMNFLRTYANSHREELPRVYQELKKYNFWRNLYGCKWYALCAYIIVLVREMVIIENFHLKEVVLSPFPKYCVVLGLFIWTLLFCLIVTRKTVTRNAFDYAKTLLDTIEPLSQQGN